MTFHFQCITIIVLCSIGKFSNNSQLACFKFSLQKVKCNIQNQISTIVNIDKSSVSELAVLVFVHGESWSWGSAALYDARILATLGRIIVVTFNYRLGIFGEL